VISHNRHIGWPGSRPSFALAVLLATALGAGVGCYKPTIQDGGFRCNQDFVQPCPGGYFCAADNRCHRSGTTVDAAVDLPTETARLDVQPEVVSDAGDAGDGRLDPSDVSDARPDQAEVAPVCLMPVAGCTAQAGKCDPMCQSGCGCREKCSVNTNAVLTCNAPLSGARRQLGQSCDISNAGALSQTDNCEPGLVCLVDSCGSRCYQFCHADKDCKDATCSVGVGGGVKVCDVPAVTCNPVGSASAMGCSATALVCYASGSAPDRTFCDCPAGVAGPNAACSSSIDCFRGLVCVDAAGGTDFRCRQVCDLTAGAASGCPGTCIPMNGSKKYGFCN
jgi:hypothetical protein